MSYDEVLLALLFLIPAAVIGILFALFSKRRRAVEVAGYVIGGIGFVGLAVCFGGATSCFVMARRGNSGLPPRSFPGWGQGSGTGRRSKRNSAEVASACEPGRVAK